MAEGNNYGNRINTNACYGACNCIRTNLDDRYGESVLIYNIGLSAICTDRHGCGHSGNAGRNGGNDAIGGCTHNRAVDAFPLVTYRLVPFCVSARASGNENPEIVARIFPVGTACTVTVLAYSLAT